MERRPRVFWALVCSLKPTRRGHFLQKGHFSPASANIPTRPTYAATLGLRNASETVSNDSGTLQQCSTSGLHFLLGVFMQNAVYKMVPWHLNGLSVKPRASITHTIIFFPTMGALTVCSVLVPNRKLRKGVRLLVDHVLSVVQHTAILPRQAHHSNGDRPAAAGVPGPPPGPVRLAQAHPRHQNTTFAVPIFLCVLRAAPARAASVCSGSEHRPQWTEPL
jgi:hypothetical protein